MSKDKMEWAIYKNPTNGETKEIYYENIDKDEYESKYKNHLTCISGCEEARIKFTHRINGLKFFSTWNKEGNKHNEECPFRLEYRGTVGRKKLKAHYEKRTITDNDIEKTLLNKIKNLKIKYNGEEKDKKHTYSNKVENTGELDVSVGSDINREAVNNFIKERRDHNITSVDANHLTKSYVNHDKCVYGVCSNVQLGQDNGEYYGYINLKNLNYTVSVYLPKAFYSQENNIAVEDFKKILEILKKDINDKGKKAIVVCYGKIEDKKKEGLNVKVINPKHILINEMNFKNILYRGSIKEIDFDI